MQELEDIHEITHEELQKRFALQPEQMKYRFPVRPLRMLGFLKFDGYVYNSELFLRVLILKTNLPGGRARSIFLCPRANYHLPLFTSETIFLGKKIIFLVDVQQAFPYSSHDNDGFFQRLTDIRAAYPDLMRAPRKPEGRIAELFSRAACYATITDDLAQQALSLHRDYLNTYLDMAKTSRLVSGDRLDRARKDLETYIDIMINHDPAMKNVYMCFGKKKGRLWALNLFFNR